jgi:hypothetical protein
MAVLMVETTAWNRASGLRGRHFDEPALQNLGIHAVNLAEPAKRTPRRSR